jgi:hypothetical protein
MGLTGPYATRGRQVGNGYVKMIMDTDQTRVKVEPGNQINNEQISMSMEIRNSGKEPRLRPTSMDIGSSTQKAHSEA